MTAARRNVVLQLHAEEYHDFVDYLRGLEFECVVLGVPGARYLSKPQLLVQYVRGLFRLLARRSQLRDVGTLVVFGRFGFVVKLAARLGLLHYERLICFGFFVQEPGWFPVFRWVARLDTDADHYVVFSESEVVLYENRLGIARSHLHFVPLGDWGQLRQSAKKAADGGYYFAGGRSNRDFRTLVEVFGTIPQPLVIVCSRTNAAEFNGLDIPPNVDIFYDLPIDRFDDYLRGARAGIVALKHDTGASGQSIALSLMRNAKAVIASDSGPLLDYVEHGVTGYLLSNFRRDLAGTICQVEEQHLAEELGRAGRERYERKFSRAAAGEAFERVLESAALARAA